MTQVPWLPLSSYFSTPRVAQRFGAKELSSNLGPNWIQAQARILFFFSLI
jgi:hypothetical protein